MAEGALVGIDYGELDIRVAYAQRDALTATTLEISDREPSIVFDPMRNVSSLGVGFPSLLHSIGIGRPVFELGRNASVEMLIQRRLADIADRLSRETGSTPGKTVIAVSSSFGQRKRHTLVECARQAGFSDVSLVDRSIAVAIGARSDRERSATYVVFGLDYGACDYALARLARDRCWIVGAGFDPHLSGERLDALIMEDIVLALRNRQVFLGLRGFNPDQWQEFRQFAEQIRTLLAHRQPVERELDAGLTGGSPVVLRFDPERFASAVRRHLAEALDNVNAILEQNQLEIADVDAVLLTGSIATVPPVASIVWDAFPRRIARTAANVAARGALGCAADAAGVRLVPGGLSEPELSSDIRGLGGGGGDQAADSGQTGAARFTDVVHFPQTHQRPQSPAVEPAPRSGGDRIDALRELARRGLFREAEHLAAGLSGELGEIVDELNGRAASGPQQLIQQAQALVVEGRYSEAVSLSHQAYDAAPHDPQVFLGMMKIHADAGLGLNTPEHFEDSISILRCAYGHDQTDRNIHKALGARHYQHALAMMNLNDVERALEAAHKALAFDPKHAPANELLAELLRPDVPGSEPAR